MQFSWLRAGWQPLLVIYGALFVPLFRPAVGVADPAGYYVWARSALIDGDLHLGNEFSHYGMAYDLLVTPTGYVHNQWAAGSAWLWLPAMCVAHGVVKLSALLGAPVAPDGYSWPYVWAAALTTSLTGLGALLIVHHLARAIFSPLAALLAVVTVWLATPLVFYQYHQPLMSHANDAFLNALFVLAWWQARQRSFAPGAMVWLGLVIGGAVWVRTQNGTLLLALLLERGLFYVETAWRGSYRSALRAMGMQMPSLLAGFALLAVPLSFFWQTIYGAWVVNTYTASGGGVLDWRAPHWLAVLVSSDRGLLVWAPVILLCLAGVPRLVQVDRRLALLLILGALLHWYVISSWSFWSGGDAFGPRLWLALLPFWGLGLAAWVDGFQLRQPLVRIGLVMLLGFFVVWNGLLMLQYSIGLVAPTGEVDLMVMVKNQFEVAPQLLSQVAERIIRMSRW